MMVATAAERPTARVVAGGAASPHLDALRILAAIGIVILHYSNYLDGSTAGRFLFAHVGHFNFFVDLFFVISGYVIGAQYLERLDSRKAVGRFLWRRLARIYPLHAVTLAFYVGVAVLLSLGLVHVENPARYPLSDIPAQVLLLHAIDGQRLTFNFPSWSLSAEMLCYMLFPLIALVGLRRPRAIVGLTAAAALVLTAYSIAAHTEPWPQWINQGGAWRALPSFLLGVSLYLFRERVAAWPVGGILLPAFLGFVVAGWALPDLTALLLVYVIAVAAIHCDQAGANTALVRLGVGRWAHLTYSSYMLHMPVATIIVTVAGRYLARSLPDAPWILVGLAAVVLALVSAASYRFFENPLRHALNSGFDRRLAGRPDPAIAAAPPSAGAVP